MTVTTRPRTLSTKPAPRLRAVFLATMRAEWTKLCTVRSTFWTLTFTVVALVGLGVLFTALEAARWDRRTPQETAEFNPLIYSLAGMNLAQISVGVLGVLVMTSEYSTGAISSTLAATPQRAVLLGAKIATFAAAVSVVSATSTLAAFLLGQAILGTEHGGLSITDTGVLRGLFGGAGFLVLIGIIAVGLGAVLRRTAGAVAVLFGVLLVVPGLVTLLPGSWSERVGKLLPGAAGEAMAAPERVATLLSPITGTLVLGLWAAAALVAGGLVLARRDA
ncbi:MAG: transporter permease [Acidimicrobiales bacterium]|nr:transporter permease [Acidimicrobiales bacterium]